MKDHGLLAGILSQNKMLEDVTLKDSKLAIKVILRVQQTDISRKKETIIDGEDYIEEVKVSLNVEDATRI